MKHLLLLSFLFLFITTSAQTFGEVELYGKITVPAEADSAGIAVYNKNTGKGSVSTKDGEFSIVANLNDSLYLSALQYQSLLVVVDENMIKRGTLQVEITENINELPEVVIKPHDLTGNLTADLQNIPIQQLDLPAWSAAELNNMDFSFAPDGQSAVSNAAMGGGTGKHGFQPKMIIGGLVDLLIPNSNSKVVDPFEKKASFTMLEKELTSRYDPQFFEEVLQIEREKISAFIAFLSDQGVSQVLLKKGKELQLLDLMVLQSVNYRQK
ncbi:hypothetical protein [Salinimicrobium terrae]|uniref:hypothetical protein n=1 Tax=Salinimicrobium terrae TaxID=470866 RepID=UPI000410958A|nr:hypothetical protein [Salinimicrobium terrae]